MNNYKKKEDQFFMALALKQAKVAFNKSELPVGAIIISKDKKILSRGYNKVESKLSQSKHAEIIAIERACKKIKNWRLNGCTIYITLEPCLMCSGLIALSRIERIVYGVKSPLFGYNIDNQSCPNLYKKHIKGITQGILSDKIETLLNQFFKNKRKSKSE